MSRQFDQHPLSNVDPEELTQDFAYGFAHSYVFQPVVQTGNREVVFQEMLSRIHGTLSVQQFILNAEQSGAIVPYDISNLMRALALIAGPDRPTGSLARLAVNLSTQTISEPWMHVLFKSNITRYLHDRDDLIIEITETSRGDWRVIQRFCDLAREHNIRVALDDFGDCMNCVDLYDMANPDIVKICSDVIEQGFVAMRGTDIPLADFIDEAKSNSKILIAENIDTLARHDKALEMGFDCLQGFYIAPPDTSPFI